MNELIVKDIKMKMKIIDIPKVEEWKNLSINIFTLSDKNDIIPLSLTSKQEVEAERIIDLLYIKNKHVSHYCLIKGTV